jgi:glutamate dehydrogenase (NAD(P)+)
MKQALLAVWQKSQEIGATLRTAAYAVACERILTARKERGLYP